MLFFGWTTASWGEVEECIEIDHAHIGTLHYIPKLSPLRVIVDHISDQHSIICLDKSYFFQIILSSTGDGGDYWYPSGSCSISLNFFTPTNRLKPIRTFFILHPKSFNLYNNNTSSHFGVFCEMFDNIALICNELPSDEIYLTSSAVNHLVYSRNVSLVSKLIQTLSSEQIESDNDLFNYNQELELIRMEFELFARSSTQQPQTNEEIKYIFYGPSAVGKSFIAHHLFVDHELLWETDSSVAIPSLSELQTIKIIVLGNKYPHIHTLTRKMDGTASKCMSTCYSSVFIPVRVVYNKASMMRCLSDSNNIRFHI
jgi:hypothetical protein